VLFLVIGYFSGIFVGMLGIGGGLIFVPALYALLPLLNIAENQLIHTTIATSLLAGAIATASAGYLHLKNNNIVLTAALLTASGCVFTAFVTPYFVIQLRSTVIEIMFAIIFILVALKMFFTKPDEEALLSKKPINQFFFVALGILVGTFAAFTGLGGGIIYVPALVYLFAIDTKKAIGTSAFITSITMISSSISYLLLTPQFNNSTSTGFVYLFAALPLGISAVAGSFLGVKILNIVSTIAIKKIFSILLIAAVIGAGIRTILLKM
jgi:uncharacterized membrane protein YfcA